VKFLIINGPNLNLLGQREPDIYGRQDYAALCQLIRDHALQRGVEVDFFQSNHEGAIIDEIQQAQGRYDAIVINPGAYTHYSYAIHDALTSIQVPAIEIHISDISQREPFRRHSVVAPACVGQIYGHGFQGYLMAMDRFLEEKA
jgi:3-dehydroquinate dehydratase-2